MKLAHIDDVDERIRSLYASITINPYPESVLADANKRPQVRVTPSDKPVTADCYSAHAGPWCGCATPKRRAAEMNKREAKAQSIAGVLSIGVLRQFIDAALVRGGVSKVNPAFTLEQSCEIYKKAIQGRDNAEIPRGVRYDVYRRRDVPSRDSLIIRNILRDCA